MAFSDGVLDEVIQIEEGEVITTSPYNVDNYDQFEDGLKIGHFAKLDTGSVDNLDGSATPVIIGVPKRKVNKAISSEDYVATAVNGLKDANADVCNFGRITAVMSDLAIAAATATEGDQVYVVNSATPGLAGKVTNNSLETDALIVPDCTFKREKQSGIWVVTIQKYLV